jgi:hypothetical protein
VEIGRRNFPVAVAIGVGLAIEATLAEGAAETQAGSTILNIGVAPRIVTERQQTDLAALREATPLRIAKLVLDNS